MNAVSDNSSPKATSKAKSVIRPAPAADYNKVKRNAKGIFLFVFHILSRSCKFRSFALCRRSFNHP